MIYSNEVHLINVLIDEFHVKTKMKMMREKKKRMILLRQHLILFENYWVIVHYVVLFVYVKDLHRLPLNRHLYH